MGAPKQKISRLDILREQLSKDQYQAFKDGGLSDREVLRKLGIANMSWLGVMKCLKKEWGISGMPINSHEESLCNYCKNAVPQLCSWIGKSDLTGLEYKRRIARYDRGNGTFYQDEIITVLKCQKYQEGELPPLKGLI